MKPFDRVILGVIGITIFSNEIKANASKTAISPSTGDIADILMFSIISIYTMYHCYKWTKEE